MITQHYKLKATTDHIREGRPGQFVFDHNESDKVIGFIDFVSDESICIMLFEPTDLPDSIGATSISESCDWRHRLTDILAEDREVREMWEEAFENTMKEAEGELH